MSRAILFCSIITHIFMVMFIQNTALCMEKLFLFNKIIPVSERLEELTKTTKTKKIKLIPSPCKKKALEEIKLKLNRYKKSFLPTHEKDNNIILYGAKLTQLILCNYPECIPTRDLSERDNSLMAIYAYVKHRCNFKNLENSKTQPPVIVPSKIFSWAVHKSCWFDWISNALPDASKQIIFVVKDDQIVVQERTYSYKCDVSEFAKIKNSAQEQGVYIDKYSNIDDLRLFYTLDENELDVDIILGYKARRRKAIHPLFAIDNFFDISLNYKP